MMKKRLFPFILSFLFFSFISPRPSLYTSADSQRPAIRTIIIDPGHGGIDPGARGTFSTEAEVALKVSLKLGKALQAEFPDIKIVYTRTSNVLPGGFTNTNQALHYRADLANKSKGDLFISIHCNSAGLKPGGWYAKRIIGHKNRTVTVGKGRRKKKKTVKEPIYETYWVENKAKGTETYIWAADRTDDKSEYIGESIEDSTNSFDLNSPEARIQAQLWVKKYFQDSYTLADYVEKEYQKSNRASRDVKQRNNKGIWVLQATGMPSILTEIGYITNTEEEQYLNSDSGQNEIAEDLLAAFRNYKNYIEGKKK